MNDSSNLSKAPVEAIRFLAKSMCHHKGLLGDWGEEIVDPLTYPSTYIGIHIDLHEKIFEHRSFNFCVCFFLFFLRRNKSTRMTRNDCFGVVLDSKHHIADGVSFLHKSSSHGLFLF